MSGEWRGGSRIERILLLLALVALAVALAVSEVARFRDRDALTKAAEALESDIATARSEANAALAAVIAPEKIATANASIYLIVVNGVPRGTAFVVDREAGVLAAAAHTAASLPIGEDGADVRLINRTTPRAMAVTGVRLHAGFGAFRRVVEDYQPIRKTSSIYAPKAVALRDMAFDVAFITVDPVDAETGALRLGPALKIAPEEKLLALAAGAPIAVIGYPYDTLDNGIMANVATPRVERGIIAAMIAPLDDASEASDPVIANLIIHRLATAGGSSGSPVMNADGEVIGIHSHGIESISSNADGAAQRADVLYDLMAADREAARINEIFMPAWRRRLTHWARAEDVLPWSFYKEYHEPGETPPPLVGDIDYGAPPPFAKRITRMSFDEASGERRIEARDAPQIADNADAAPDGALVIREPGEYAETWVSVDRRRENVLFAYDYSLRRRRGACQLTTYWRKRGAPRFEAQRERASFELYLPAANAVVEDYHVVIRRDVGCDPLSREFTVGDISWAASAALVLTAPESASVLTGKDRVFQLAHSAQHRLSAFVTCAFFGPSHRDQCADREFVEIETANE